MNEYQERMMLQGITEWRAEQSIRQQVKRRTEASRDLMASFATDIKEFRRKNRLCMECGLLLDPERKIICSRCTNQKRSVAQVVINRIRRDTERIA